MLLWWGRDAFYVRHDPIRLRGAAWRVPAIVLGAYALTALAAFAAAPHAGFATIRREAADLLLLDSGPIHFGDELAWVPLGAGLLGVALAGRDRLRRLPAARRAAAACPTPTCGAARPSSCGGTASDTLSYFKLRRDTHYLFSPDRRAFVGYRIENGVLLVSGDPIGPDEALPALARAVCRHSRGSTGSSSQHSAPASGCCRSGARPGCGRCTWATRRSWTRARSRSRAGRSARCASRSRGSRAPATRRRWCRWPSSTTRPSAELEHVSALWRDGAAERGFSMAMDVAALRGAHATGASSWRATETAAIRGFIHFVPSYGRPAMSLVGDAPRP